LHGTSIKAIVNLVYLIENTVVQVCNGYRQEKLNGSKATNTKSQAQKNRALGFICFISTYAVVGMSQSQCAMPYQQLFMGSLHLLVRYARCLAAYQAA
jgi:hypothetical protein